MKMFECKTWTRTTSAIFHCWNRHDGAKDKWSQRRRVKEKRQDLSCGETKELWIFLVYLAGRGQVKIKLQSCEWYTYIPVISRTSASNEPLATNSTSKTLSAQSSVWMHWHFLLLIWSVKSSSCLSWSDVWISHLKSQSETNFSSETSAITAFVGWHRMIRTGRSFCGWTFRIMFLFAVSRTNTIPLS